VTFAYTKPSSGSVLEDTVSNDAVSLNNVFIGTAGANAINGTTSDDFIIGNSAVDTLTGNGGNDIFDYNALSDGNDVITDFTIGDGGDADKLNLKDLLDYSSTDTLANFLQFTHVGTDVTVGISVEGGDTFTADLTLTLSNMGTETLGLSDFVDNNLVVL
jgi:Ca2+-binding RTX toxin-like protein